MALLLAACSSPTAAPVGSASPSLGLQTPFGGNPDPACAETPRTTDRPKNPNTAAFSTYWYVSADHLLWASAPGSATETRLFADDNKMLWERPGAVLEVTGHPVGRASPTVRPSLPSGYDRFDYQASGLAFPEAGCWEVEARAGQSTLRFVVLVRGLEYRSAVGSCIDLADVTRQSSAVVDATVLEEQALQGGFGTLRLRLNDALRGSLPPEIAVLRDHVYEPPLQTGHRYLLFLKPNGGGVLRIICPDRTLFEIDGARVLPPADPRGMWDGESLDAFETRIRAVAGR